MWRLTTRFALHSGCVCVSGCSAYCPRELIPHQKNMSHAQESSLRSSAHKALAVYTFTPSHSASVCPWGNWRTGTVSVQSYSLSWRRRRAHSFSCRRQFVLRIGNGPMEMEMAFLVGGGGCGKRWWSYTIHELVAKCVWKVRSSSGDRPQKKSRHSNKVVKVAAVTPQ